MPACQACHRAKVRCVQGFPSCARCQRLGVDCVPHVSQQGQGPKKRRKRQQQQKQEQQQEQQQERVPIKSEDELVLQNAKNCGRHHYGIMYSLYQWTSFAFARRSLDLLGKAIRLAQHCGIPMNDFFCPDRQEYLNPLIFDTTATMTTTTTTQLTWSDIPPTLAKVCFVDNHDKNGASREQRYIMVRECNKGESRYLVSQAFERDISSQWILERTWQLNEQPVAKVFLQSQADFDKYSKAVNYQIARYTQPSIVPECARINGFNVKTIHGGVQEMDLVHALEIVNLEVSFFLFEFVLPTKSPATSEVATTPDNTTALFADLGDLTMDKDLEMVFDLLAKSSDD